MSGDVQVIGRASVDDFDEYYLEYGEGDDPDDWSLIVSRQSDESGGTLGVWETDGLAPGEYTLRLTVEDDDGDDYEASVVVEVGGSSGGSDNDDDDIFDDDFFDD